MPELDQKFYEGLMLSLSAQAEVLSRMDERLSKADDKEEKEEDEKKEEVAKAAFLKEFVYAATPIIVDAVRKELAPVITKAPPGESPVGMDVDGKTERKVSGTSWPMGANPAEDREQAANPKVDTRTVGQPISLADKKSVVKDMGGMPLPDEEEDEDEKEYPKKEDGAPEDELASIKSQLGALAKSIELLSKGVTVDNSKVKKAVDSALRKVGFKEVEGLKRTKATILGDDSINASIQKSDGPKSSEDIVDALSKRSYSELALLQLTAFKNDGLIGDMYNKS